MSLDRKDQELPESVAAAIAAGTNVVRALRDWAGYSVEELAVTSGLAIDEIVALEAADEADPVGLHRITTALGLSGRAFIAN